MRAAIMYHLYVTPSLKLNPLTPYGLDTHICAFNFDDVCRPQILNFIIHFFAHYREQSEETLFETSTFSKGILGLRKL